MTYHYFISIYYKKEAEGIVESGMGNCEVPVREKIETLKQIHEIEKFLKKQEKYTSCIVISYQLFKNRKLK